MQRINRLRAALLVAIVGPFLTGMPTASAGIQNVQSALTDDAEEGLSGNATVGADWRTGNISFLFLSASLVTRYRAGQHLWIGLANLERKTNADSVLVSRTFEHLRYRYRFDNPWTFEAFAQHEFNGIKRLKVRALGGAGANLELIKSERIRVAIGTAYMLEYEAIRDDDEIDSGDDSLAHRLSNYFVGAYALDDRVSLLETFYIQPRLNDFNDTRLLSESSVVVELSKRVSMSTSFNLAYDSRPPIAIQSLDTALKTTITLQW